MIDALKALFYHGPNGTSPGDLLLCAVAVTIAARALYHLEEL